MATIDVFNIKNSKVGQLELSEEIFNADVNEGLLHTAVRVQLMNRRGGNACTKTRAEVKGSGAKPWKQKGTGRARSGQVTSPIWVGGGTVFGPQTKEYSLTLNKKVRKQALRSALSMKYKENALVVLENIELAEVKTKAFAEIMNAFGASDALVVLEAENRNVDLSSRNLKGVKVMRSEGLNVYDIVKYKTLFVTKGTVGKIEEVLAK